MVGKLRNNPNACHESVAPTGTRTLCSDHDGRSRRGRSPAPTARPTKPDARGASGRQQVTVRAPTGLRCAAQDGLLETHRARLGQKRDLGRHEGSKEGAAAQSALSGRVRGGRKPKVNPRRPSKPTAGGGKPGTFGPVRGPWGLELPVFPSLKGLRKSGQRSLTSRVCVYTSRPHPCLKLPSAGIEGKGEGFTAGIFMNGPSFPLSVNVPLHPSGRQAAVATLPAQLRAARQFWLPAPPRTLPHLRLASETPPLPGPLHPNGPCRKEGAPAGPRREGQLRPRGPPI